MARHRAKMKKLKDEERALAVAEKPLVHDLKRVGRKVKSVWDLVNTDESYPESIPVLLAHFDIPYPKPIHEGIIKALTAREARGGPAMAILLRAFRTEKNEHLKWTIGNALSEVADASVAKEIIELASDPSHGKARQMLLVALHKIGTEETQRILSKLLKQKRLSALYKGASMR